MNRFVFLMVVALFDLVVAGVLIGRGHPTPAFLFLLMAAMVGGYALFSAPAPAHSGRGTGKSADFPYAGVLGTLGAFAILLSAGYVVWNGSRTSSVQPEPSVQARAPAAPAAVYQPPSSYRQPRPAALIYKCVDARKHTSIQSQPCPAGSEQVWVRDATPEPPSRRTQRNAYSSPPPQASAAPRSTGTDASNPSASSACRAARAADAAYRAQPLSRIKHDGLRWHGDRIREACN